MDNSLLTQLINRATIIEVVNRFGMTIDLRDWDNFRKLFTNSVEFDYSSIGETAGTLHPDDIVDTARKDLSGFQATQHLITNHQVELFDNAATCHAHVRAQHFLPNEQGDPLFEMGGYYTAELVRTESDWQIKRWKFSVLWSCGNQELFSIARNKPSK